jgi:hypothetical protein
MNLIRATIAISLFFLKTNILLASSSKTCTLTGRVVKLNPKLLHEKLQKEGKTFEEYAKTFVARKARIAIGEGRIKVTDGVAVEVKENPPKRPDFADQKAKRKETLKVLWKRVCKESPEYYLEKYKP